MKRYRQPGNKIHRALNNEALTLCGLTLADLQECGDVAPACQRCEQLYQGWLRRQVRKFGDGGWK